MESGIQSIANPAGARRYTRCAMKRCWRVLPLILLFCGRISAAPACISGNNLASYVALGSGGCDIGPLAVKDFVFGLVCSGGGAIPLNESGITVTAVFAPTGFGLSFASGGFCVAGSGFVNDLLGFTWDPTGDLRGAGDILDPG